MFLNSPLEQFEIFSVFSYVPQYFINQPLFFFELNPFYNYSVNFMSILELSVSNSFITLVIICFLFIFFFHILYFSLSLISSNWLRGNFLYLQVIKNIIVDLITHSLGRNYYYLFFSFVFILINVVNVCGLIPYTFVLTSQFFFTFGLAFFFFCNFKFNWYYFTWF